VLQPGPAVTDVPQYPEFTSAEGFDPSGEEEPAGAGSGSGGSGSPAPPGRGRHRRRGRRGRLLLTGLGLLVLIVLAFGLWYELQSHALGPPGRREIVQVAAGESVSSVASTLSADKVIGSTFAFKVSGLVHGNPTLQPGSYEFHQNLTFAEVRSILSGGPNIYAVTVNPGLTLSEVATRVDALPGHGGTSFAHLAASGAVHSLFSPAGSDNLEGLLGTGTYLVLPGETDTTILVDMVKRFDSQATSAGLTTASASALGLTPYQLVTAASVVEKEGYIAKNMPDVARVIYNRLGTNTPLQMDSTVLYSLGQDGGPVTPQDLQLPSPYNSYLNKGLPPTPICNPSPTAVSAAVHPPAGGWLYFVVVDKAGTEAFSVTFAGQLANEKLAQQRGVG
jgi:UPF0755 protein